MKKIILLFILLMHFTLLNAQLGFTLGPKVGFTATKLSSNKDEMLETFQANFMLGAFMRISDHRLYIQPEFNIKTKGGLFSSDKLLGIKELSLTTFEVPILIGIRVAGDRANNLHIMAGQTISFTTEKNIRLDNSSELDDSMFENVLWGFQAGIGLDLIVLTLDLRYEWGINNLLISGCNGVSLKNRMIEVSLGWKLF